MDNLSRVNAGKVLWYDMTKTKVNGLDAFTDFINGKARIVMCSVIEEPCFVSAKLYKKLLKYGELR